MELEVQEHINQGIAYMSADNFNRAVDEFKSAVESDPTQIEGYIHLGNAYASLEDYDNALKTFKTALMHDNENGRILYSIGGVYLLLNDVASAIRYYNRAEEAGYSSVEMYMILSGVFADAGDYAMAIQSISKAIELSPLRGELYSEKASLQVRFNLLDEAIETLDEFRELIPDSLDSYELGVQVYSMREEYEAAEKIVDEGLEHFPNDPAIQMLKLRVLVDSKQYSKGKDYADIVLQNPLTDEQTEQRAIMSKATCYAQMGNIKDVIRILEDYTAKNKDVQTLYLLMNTYLVNQDYRGVKICADELKGLDLDAAMRAAAIYYKANAVQKTDGIDPARAEYNSILPELRKLSLEAPENYEIYIYRLLCHVELEEFDKALELADYLENAYPELPDGHLYKFHIYKRTGDKDHAAEERKLALEIAPNLQLEPA